MSEPTETEEQDTVTETEDMSTTETEPTDEHERDDQEQEDEPTSNEAARYRRRLREVEAEREALGRNLAAVQRQLVEGMVSGLGDPADLWHGGVNLAELVSDDGTVDPARVADAAKRVVADHPSWAARTPDLGQGRRTRTAAAGPSWSDLLDPTRI